MAAAVGVAMTSVFSVELYYCFEKSGVLTDIKDEASLIEQLSFGEYQTLKEDGIIADGMIPKLDNAFYTLQQGISKVCIMHQSQVKHLEKQQFKAQPYVSD